MATPQWTVSIIAQYSDRDIIVRENYEALISTIRRQGNTSVNFFVMRYHTEANKTSFFSYQYDSAEARRVEQRSDPKSTQNFYESPDVMVEFFRDNALTVNDTHHFVMLWGHGAGFGTFAEGSLPEPEYTFLKGAGYGELKQKFSRTTALYTTLLASGVATRKNERERITGMVADFSDRNNVKSLQSGFQALLRETFRMVSIETIAFALSKSFGAAGDKVDILYAMSCYMQMFESGFLLNDHVDYYGGSEAFQLFHGPDYNQLFRHLGGAYAVRYPDMNRLVSDIVKDFIDLYTGPASPGSVNPNVLCLTFSYLPEFERFIRQLNDLATYAMQHREIIYPLIRIARARCISFTGFEYGIIDIAQFCSELLKENLPGGTLRQILEQIVDRIQENGPLIIARKPAAALCTTLPGNGENNSECPQGLSIFFPTDMAGSLYDEYVHAFMKKFYEPDSNRGENIFLAASGWDEFVLDYYFYGNFPPL